MPWWRSWLRHCATSWKIAGLIPDSVIGIFYWRNPTGRTMILGSTRPLTEMSTRNISWEVKAAGAWGWETYHLYMPTVLKSGSLNLLEPLGSVQACNGIAVPLTRCKCAAIPLLFHVVLARDVIFLTQRDELFYYRLYQPVSWIISHRLSAVSTLRSYLTL
jgi:hypothetical protein